MLRIYPEVICHKLHIRANAKLVKQKPRGMNEKRSCAISNEVDRLLQVGFIRETFYPDWISNPVLVKKKNRKWRVRIDFTNLINKVCPKDSYLLPRINQIVETTVDHELLSFMDTYSSYNQIKMHPPDKDKITFIICRGIYCYKMMPFGLKNAGPPSNR